MFQTLSCEVWSFGSYFATKIWKLLGAGLSQAGVKETEESRLLFRDTH